MDRRADDAVLVMALGSATLIVCLSILLTL
jgi:hypothetical protein